ncbi:MAG: DUF6178 family protein [Deltaproteobacteria bacterium]|nr:DUF6178 family protein [Deltaproteobacteria bacterium]
MDSFLLPTRRQIREVHELLFDKECWEQFPIEQIYFALKEYRFEDFPDLIPHLTTEQINVLVCLNCWNVDQFEPVSFTEIISVCLTSVDAMAALIKNVDALFLSRYLVQYVGFKIFEEKQDYLEIENAFTVDQGYTWLWIRAEDPDEELVVRGLIEFLRSVPQKLFELLSIAASETPTTLEEKSFNEKNRIFSIFGLPDYDLAKELTSGVILSGSYDFEFSESDLVSQDHPGLFHPLNQIVERIVVGSELKKEFVDFLRNLVFSVCMIFRVDFRDQENIKKIEEFCLATMNVGVQKAISAGETLDDFRDLTNLRIAFQVGLHDILFFFRKFKSVDAASWEPELRYVVESIQNFPPKLPKFFFSKGLISSDNRYKTDLEPISRLSQLKALKVLLENAKRAS